MYQGKKADTAGCLPFILRESKAYLAELTAYTCIENCVCGWHMEEKKKRKIRILQFALAAELVLCLIALAGIWTSRENAEQQNRIRRGI